MAGCVRRPNSIAGIGPTASATQHALTLVEHTDELWQKARALRARAEALGAVVPFPHTAPTMQAAGIVWNVRVLTGSAPHAATEPDPFLPPYDRHLHVADLIPDHALLLNKFPVLSEHLLIVTRAYAAQAVFPEPHDFSAAAQLLDGPPALVFYNGGVESGASQPHRHFQAVALPLGPAPEPIPTARWIEAAAHGAALPFTGAAALCNDAWQHKDVGAPLHKLGTQLLRRCGRDPAAPGAFNLLFTREWMLVVPRCRRKYQGVPVNSLGFAGALITKSEASERALEDAGPLAVLRNVTGDASLDNRAPPG